MHSSAAATSPEGRLYRAIADPVRRALLDRLREGEQPAGALVEAVGASQPSVSKHLRLLREAGLVTERRDGRRRLYRLNPEPLAAVDAWVSRYRMFWSGRVSKLARAAEKRRRG